MPTRTGTDFVQINQKKALLAAVELQRSQKEKDSFVCMLTEPYRFKDKVRALPINSRCIAGTTKPRAALIHSLNIPLVNLEELNTSDCAVGLLKEGESNIVIASVYLDVKLEVVPPWLQKIVAYADKNSYGLIIGADTNAHSTLYGEETNKRGEELEDFIIGNFLSPKTCNIHTCMLHILSDYLVYLQLPICE